MSFWDFWWLLFLGYLLLAWLVMLYAIIRDLLQAPELSGVAKALWTIGLIAVPVLGSVIYLIARGLYPIHQARRGR